MDIVFILMALGVSLSFLLLYARKKKWNNDRLRWLLTGLFFLIGTLGPLIDDQYKEKGYHFLFIPLIYNCFDRWFKRLSIRKTGRDFYLYLRHSSEIDEWIGAKNPHVMASDKLFSILLLVIIMGLMVGGILVYRDFNY